MDSVSHLAPSARRYILGLFPQSGFAAGAVYTTDVPPEAERLPPPEAISHPYVTPTLALTTDSVCVPLTLICRDVYEIASPPQAAKTGCTETETMNARMLRRTMIFRNLLPELPSRVQEREEKAPMHGISCQGRQINLKINSRCEVEKIGMKKRWEVAGDRFYATRRKNAIRQEDDFCPIPRMEKE